ncbi:MAG TPA: GNAT family N-acetyltransferase, partial [Ilumatobacteraceae bacterium]|nr:GNAT family N-acetyltransferase [Ilumatobacteraceae bacterium]
DVARDARLALIDGELAGWVLVNCRRTDDVQERAFVDGTVLPSARGRGVGRALFDWAIPEARQRLKAIDNDLPAFIRVYAAEQIETLARLLQRFGFAPERWFEELVRPLAERPNPPTPVGLDIVPWDAPRRVAAAAQPRVRRPLGFGAGGRVRVGRAGQRLRRPH